MHVKYNSVHQYKIRQSLKNDWFAKLNYRQIFILYGIQDNEKKDGPTPKKSKLGKFLGKKYGLGKTHSAGASTIMSPLEKASSEMTMYLQYP